MWLPDLLLLLEKEKTRTRTKRSDIVRPQCVSELLAVASVPLERPTLQIWSRSPPSADLSDPSGDGIRACRQISAQNGVWRRLQWRRRRTVCRSGRAVVSQPGCPVARPPVHRVFSSDLIGLTEFDRGKGNKGPCRGHFSDEQSDEAVGWWLHNLISSPVDE